MCSPKKRQRSWKTPSARTAKMTTDVQTIVPARLRRLRRNAKRAVMLITARWLMSSPKTTFSALLNALRMTWCLNGGSAFHRGKQKFGSATRKARYEPVTWVVNATAGRARSRPAGVGTEEHQRRQVNA